MPVSYDFQGPESPLRFTHTMTPQRIPLLNFEYDMQTRSPLSSIHSDSSFSGHPDARISAKKWYHYIPLCVLVLIMLAPHPSWLYVLVDFHLLTMKQYLAFGIHLMITYTLTLCAFASLIVLVVRDPGSVTKSNSLHDTDDDVELTEALMRSGDNIQYGSWCYKCEAPKPERTHHCGLCDRCVLKMDHHCPWLASKCIGHRTYPAFIHFLTCITLLSLYIGAVSGMALIYAFNNPFAINEDTPIHEVALTFAGIVFSLMVGSFLSYHLYLVSTNQTTLESVTPFLLLRYLPPLSREGHVFSSPPVETELSYEQRRLVKDAHRHIRPYDLGWRKNWSQVFGWRSKHHLVSRLICGGSSPGDGLSFPQNPRSDELLARLAKELIPIDGHVQRCSTL